MFGLLDDQLEQRQLLTNTVSIIALDPYASEPGHTDTGMFRIARTGGDNSAALSVNYQILTPANSATSGSDYQALNGSAWIPASASFVDILVQPTPDVFVEPTELVTLQIVPHIPPYVIGSPDTATVFIFDDSGGTGTLPPVFQSPPTPDAGSTTDVSACAGEIAYVDILAYDQDNVGNPTIAYTINGPSGFSIGTNPAGGGPAVVVSSSVAAGTHSVTVTATDNEQQSVNRTFSIMLTRAPGPTTITLATANTDGVIELPSAATSTSVTLTWSADSATEYQWELWKFTDGPPTPGFTRQGPQEQGTSQSRTYPGLTVGHYIFFARGLGCTPTQFGPWSGTSFIIVNQGDLIPDDTDQHNNHEDACDCNPMPPGTDVSAGRVTTRGGDFLLDLGNLLQNGGPASGSAGAGSGGAAGGSTGGPARHSSTNTMRHGGGSSPLGSFLFPTYASGGDSQIHVDATIPLPSSATEVRVDIEVLNPAGQIVGRDTQYPGQNPQQVNKPGAMTFRINPAALKDAAGNPVAALASGNYKVVAKIRATLPGLSVVAPKLMNFAPATTDVQYVNAADRTFGKGFNATGMDRMRIDNQGISLYRAASTSARFTKNASNGYDAPANGSFSAIAPSLVSIPNPMGGPNRTSAHRLTTVSGTVSEFDANGLLLERCDSDGNVIRFSYEDRKGDGTADDLVRIQSVHTGHNITYGYVNGRVQTVSDWVGRVWTYAYDSGSGLMTSVTAPAPQAGLPASKLEFTWDTGVSQLLSYTVTDTAGNFTETTEVVWDDYGNVEEMRRLDTQGNSGGTRTWKFQSAESRQIAQIRLIDPLGAIDPLDQFSQVEYPDGSISKTQVDLFGNTLREERTVVGYLANTTITSNFQRNADGQVTTAGPLEQKVGSTVTSIPATTYAYDTLGRMFLATYPDGTTEVWTYASGASSSEPDTYKNRVGHFYDFGTYVDGSPLQVDYYASQGGVLVSTTKFTYQNGRIRTVAMQDPNGLTGSGVGIEYYYNSDLNPIHMRTTTATNAGVLAAATINDIWVSFGYDSLDNPLWATTPYRPVALTGSPAVPAAGDANLVAVRTDFTSDAFGRILTALSPVPAAGQPRLQSTFTWDALGRNKTSVEPGSAAAATRTTTTARNSFGEVRTVTEPDPDGIGPLLVPSTELVWDVNGTLQEVRAKNGTTIVSRQRYAIDSLGRVRSQSLVLPGTVTIPGVHESSWFQYDAIGRVTRVEQPVGTAGLNQLKYFVTSFVHDDSARRITSSFSTLGSGVINPGIGSIVQEFDAIGRPTKTTQGGLSVTTAYFDASTFTGRKGTLILVTDPRGQLWTRKLGRTGLTTVTETPDPDGSVATLAVRRETFNYDYRGNLDTVVESSGSLTRTTNYDFDHRDLLTSVTTPSPGAGLPALITTFVYDALERPITEISPTGVTSTTSWRDDGLRGSVNRNDNNASTPDWSTTFQYDNLNRLISSTDPDGTTTVEYDTLGNVKKMVSPDPDGPGGPLPPQSQTWTYATGVTGQFLENASHSVPSHSVPCTSAGRMREMSINETD